MSSFSNDQVIHYNGSTGAPLGVFEEAASGGIDGPFDLAFGPDGDLYVNSPNTDKVYRYAGLTGAPKGAFITAGTSGLDRPGGFTFGPDGHFYASSTNSDEVLRYEGPNAKTYQALNALYKETGGDTWTNNTNWLSGPISTWHGVTLDENAEVANLSFSDNQLMGTLPSELGNLPVLERLDVSNNKIEGNIPSTLGALQNLDELNVSDNPSMNGTLPFALSALPLTTFLFDSTDLCENSTPQFQGWLSTITTLGSTGCTGINEAEQPDQYALYPNYPNPFNSSTLIRFDLQQKGSVKVTIFDSNDRQVVTLIDSVQPVGALAIIWQPVNLSSGVYYYRLETDRFSATRQVVYVK